MSSQETIQEFNPGVDKIWNSFNQRGERTAQAERNVQKDLGLPTGFVTEKGSAYSYGKDGSIHRDKFDGTQHEAGIAVFIHDTEENLDALTRMGAVSSHLPPEMQKKAYVVQVDSEARTVTRIYKTADVIDPTSLAFALINGRNEVVSMTRASIQPQAGDYVFEMDKLPDGSTVRHPGHRVTDVIR